MGASKSIAVGRNEEKLEKLQELNEKRIISLVYSEPSPDFTVEKLKILMNGIGADLVIDFIGGTSAVEPFLTYIRALKYRGKSVEDAAKKTSEHFVDWVIMQSTKL